MGWMCNKRRQKNYQPRSNLLVRTCGWERNWCLCARATTDSFSISFCSVTTLLSLFSFNLLVTANSRPAYPTSITYVFTWYRHSQGGPPPARTAMLWRTGAFPAMKLGGAAGSASPRHGPSTWFGPQCASVCLSVPHPFYTSWCLFFIGCTKAIKLISIN